MRLSKGNPFLLLYPTKRGIMLLSCSLLALALGLVRGELATTLMGAILLSYSAFTVILLLLCSFYPRITFLVHAEYHASYYTDPDLATSKKTTLTYPIANVPSGPPDPFPRGVYYPRRPRRIYTDIPRFFVCSRRPDRPFETRVGFPSEGPCVIPDLPEGSSDSLRGKSTFRRSEDLHETRLYQPGDDPRRVNWKVYAHSGQLAVREGELLPPPNSEYAILINERIAGSTHTGKRDNVDETFLQSSLDELINRLYAVCLALMKRQCILRLIHSPIGTSITSVVLSPDDPPSVERLRHALAYPRLRADAPTLIDFRRSIPQGATILYASLPFYSDNLAALTGERERLIVLTGPTLPPKAQASVMGLLRSMLYRDTGADAPKLIDKALTKCALQVPAFRNKLAKEGFHVETL
jgi:hypothetical protein